MRGNDGMQARVVAGAYFCKQPRLGRVSQGGSGLPAGLEGLALASRGRD